MMRAELEDGRVLEFPDGTDPAVIQRTVKKMIGDLADEPEAAPEPNLELFKAARESGILKGITDSAAGAAQLVERFKDFAGGSESKTQFVDDFIKQEEQAYQSRRKSEGEEGFDVARMAGGMMSPTSVAGMASVPAKIPAMMAAGAGYGGLQPVTEGDFAETKAMQAGTGAALGLGVPMVMKGMGALGGYADEFIKPFSNKGIKRDVEKFLREHVGSGKEKIIKALQGSDEIVPGSKLTSGQMIAKGVREAKKLGEPDDFGGAMVRLEKDVARDPMAGDILKKRYAQQQAGREGVIEDIAGTDEMLSKAISTRKSATEPLYKAVEESKKVVDAKPVLDKIDDILVKNKNESSITTPLSALREKLVSGDKLETNPNALFSLSKEIKALMGKTTTSGQKEYNVKVLNEIKDVLDNQIGVAEDAFKKAQGTFKELSAPINVMQTGRELKKALLNASEKESAATFQGAVRNAPRTLKKSTGFSRYDKLDDVLPPSKTSGVKRVSDELANQAKMADMASKTGSIMQDLPAEITFSLPRILSRPIVIANAILSRFGRQLGPEYKQVLSEILKDPNALAKALQGDRAGVKYKIALDIVKKGSVIMGSQTSAREAQ